MEKFLASRHIRTKHLFNPNERMFDDFLHSVEGAVIHSITQSTAATSFGAQTYVWIVYSPGPGPDIEEQS